jgi:hypothetical protein
LGPVPYEAHVSVLVPIEDAVEDSYVKMDIEVQARTKSLDECDGADLLVRDPLGPAANAVASEYGLDEDAHEGAQHLGTKRSDAPKLKWQREHPLAHRRPRGQHAIDQSCGEIAHSAPSAARAHGPCLA